MAAVARRLVRRPLTRTEHHDRAPRPYPLDETGHGTIEIDGHDVSHSVRGFTLNAKVGRVPQLVLDLNVSAGEIDGKTQAHIPADTAALLVALGWTPPDDGQPLDLTDPKRHDQMIKIIKREARLNPHWFLPVAKGGPRLDADNLAPIHGVNRCPTCLRSCNSEKGDKLLSEVKRLNTSVDWYAGPDANGIP